MTVEVSFAADFMAGHARVLDRRRFELYAPDLIAADLERLAAVTLRAILPLSGRRTLTRHSRRFRPNPRASADG